MNRKSRKRVDPESEAIWEREWEIAEGRRKRVVRAFLALREVKTLAPSAEPAIRRVRLALLNLPSQLAEQIAHEDAETARKMLTLEVWRILDDLDERLTAGDRAPMAPANSRYITLNGELQHGDLNLK